MGDHHTRFDEAPEFPFRREFTLSELARYWDRDAAAGGPVGAIRFRLDEKRFDVDGAYNARYEIVKKRIDKATVGRGRDRLTQPGHIAIVYGQPTEAAEYREYVEYLQSLGCLTTEVEELELDELQDVRGLRALRVTVDLASPRFEKAVPSGDLDALR